MSEQELEEHVEGSDVDETQNDDTGEETGSPDKVSKNKSNFKKLHEKSKNLERQLSEAQEELEAWRSENPDIVKETLTKKETKGVDKSELALFIATNPDARDNLDAIKEFAEDFGIKLDSEESLSKVWKRVKGAIPKESESKNDFSIKTKTPAKKVDLSEVTFDEIYSKDESGRDKYTKEQRAQWRSLKN